MSAGKVKTVGFVEEADSGEFASIKRSLLQQQDDDYGTKKGDGLEHTQKNRKSAHSIAYDNIEVPPSEKQEKTEDEKRADIKRRWLTFHICVLAFLDMTAYAMCLVPFTSLLKDISLISGGGGSTSSAQTYQTICVALTSFFAFVGGSLIGGLSDSFGRFPAVLFTRFMRILFALCLVLADYWKGVPHIQYLLFVGYSIQGFCDPDMCISIFYAMIADTFTAKARTFYFGLVSSVFAAPVIIGPFIGEWIQAAWGPSIVFQIALILLAINGIYVSLVFPETLVDMPSTVQDKLKILKANANPFSFCAELRKTNSSTPYPLSACIAVYAFFGVASAALQSTILLYVEDADTLNFSVTDAAYLLSAFGALLVVSQSFGTKLFLCCLSEQVTITIGMFVLTAGLLMMCIFGQVVIPFLLGLVLTGAAYVVVPSLNGFVSKKTPVGDQGTILAILASVRSLSLGLGQIGGGATLVAFTGPDPPFQLPGFHFLMAAVFAVLGGFSMVYVCIYMCRQSHSKVIYDREFGGSQDRDNRSQSVSSAPGGRLSEAGTDIETTPNFGGSSSFRNRSRTASKGGLLVREIWGRNNSISLSSINESPFANRPSALSTTNLNRANRPHALSTGPTVPGVG